MSDANKDPETKSEPLYQDSVLRSVIGLKAGVPIYTALREMVTQLAHAQNGVCPRCGEDLTPRSTPPFTLPPLGKRSDAEIRVDTPPTRESK